MFNIRLIKKEDNHPLKTLIINTLNEYGATGDGFASSDPELNSMFDFYNNDRSIYYILENKNNIVGGAGIAPLAGDDNLVCELQKMYFLKEARGKGFGAKMITLCLQSAKEFNFKTCYLETLTTMNEAQTLYKKIGFQQLDSQMGNTGHFGCNTFYSLDLK